MEEAGGVENSNMSSDFGNNPLKGEATECLPEGHYCNANGYLLGPGPTLRSLHPCVIEAKIQFVCTDHLLIAIFIGLRPRLGFWILATMVGSSQF